MEQELWKIYNNVRFWLEYAEKKNTYIVTFIGLQLTLFKAFDFHFNVVLVISIVFLSVSFFICACSFCPETKVKTFISDKLLRRGEECNSDDNLIFFGHIAKYSLDSYIEKVEKYLNIGIKGKPYLRDLCGQIVINSYIANEKFKFFKTSIVFMFLGQVFFIIFCLTKS